MLPIGNPRVARWQANVLIRWILASTLAGLLVSVSWIVGVLLFATILSAIQCILLKGHFGSCMKWITLNTIGQVVGGVFSIGLFVFVVGTQGGRDDKIVMLPNNSFGWIATLILLSMPIAIAISLSHVQVVRKRFTNTALWVAMNSFALVLGSVVNIVVMQMTWGEPKLGMEPFIFATPLSATLASLAYGVPSGLALSLLLRGGTVIPE